MPTTGIAVSTTGMAISTTGSTTGIVSPDQSEGNTAAIIGGIAVGGIATVALVVLVVTVVIIWALVVVKRSSNLSKREDSPPVYNRG